jgi:hypothetical protein
VVWFQIGVSVELGSRHYFMWRFLQRGVNTLWLDTDTHFGQNPYPYFKSKLAKINVIMRSHIDSRCVRPDLPRAISRLIIGAEGGGQSPPEV